jgi:cytochrome P450
VPGAIAALGRDPLRLFEELSARGPVVRLPLGRAGWHLVSDPQLAREVLVARQRDFAKGIVLRRARLLLGDGLLTTDGDGHAARRRIVQPAFHGERLERCGAVIVERAARTAARAGTGGELEVRREMTDLTLGIVGPALFSADLTAEAAGVREALDDVMATFDALTVLSAPILVRMGTRRARRLAAARARLDAVVARLLAERRAEPDDRGDLLSLLLAGRDAAGAPLDDAALRDEIVTMLIAGHETTANALAWTLDLLARHPEAQERLHAELDAVLGGRPAGVADVPALRYVEAVVAESLRLYPPAWGIARRARRAVPLGPLRLDRGAIVVISPWSLGRDPRLWDRPLRFDPDRWAERSPSRPPPGYLPFGAGARGCVGRPLALLEATLALATLAQAWRVMPVPGVAPAPRPAVTLRPGGGLWLRVEPRRPVGPAPGGR